MPQYRTLSIEELEILKDDFVKFLIVQGYDSAEWEKTKSESKEKAQKLIDMFSDIVIEKSLTHMEYIEHFDGKSMKVFKCEENEIFLVAIDSNQHFASWNEMVKDITSNPSIFKLYQSNKPYNLKRNIEIFKMLEAGASIGHAEKFEMLRALMS